MTEQAATTRWREPAMQVAIVNAALFLLLPMLWIVRSLNGLLLYGAMASIVAWRSYAHASDYRPGQRSSLWRGPLEAAGVAGAIVLLQLGRMIAPRFLTQPGLAAAYLGFYVVLAGLIGLVIGLILSASAVLVLRLRS